MTRPKKTPGTRLKITDTPEPKFAVGDGVVRVGRPLDVATHGVERRRWGRRNRTWQYLLDDGYWAAESRLAPAVEPERRPLVFEYKSPAPIEYKGPAPKYESGAAVLRGGDNHMRLVTAALPGPAGWLYLLDGKTPWIPEDELSPCPYLEDHRRDNPGLHLLYVKTAVRHLTMIDRMLSEVWAQGNLNDLGSAMQRERAELLRTNPAYIDAQEILDLHEEGRTGKRKGDHAAEKA